MVQSYRGGELAASSLAKTALRGTGVSAKATTPVDKADSFKRFNQRKNIDVPDSGTARDTNHPF
jgi:hypothetical protein